VKLERVSSPEKKVEARKRGKQKGMVVGKRKELEIPLIERDSNKRLEGEKIKIDRKNNTGEEEKDAPFGFRKFRSSL